MRLTALDSDAWARVVAAARRVLRELPEVAQSPRTTRLAALPASRLSGGRGRDDLARLLADGGAVWVGVRATLQRDAPEVLDALAEDVRPPTPARPAVATHDVAELRATVDDLRGRLREVRDERDDLRRRLDGAEAREEAARRGRRSAEADLADAGARADRLAAEVAEAEQRREQAVARERRRRAGEERSVQEELRETRRQLDEARREIARLRTEATAPAAVPRTTTTSTQEDTHGMRPGRPSRLPDDVARPSREAAELLVAGSRLVLVDGWNVTRTHRASLGWSEQRRWLVEATAAMCLRLQVDVTIVFDAGSSGNPTGSTTRHGRVHVAHAPSEVTADDDLVFRAMAADPTMPITVVTDDRELRARLLEHGVDLVDTAEWVWLLH